MWKLLVAFGGVLFCVVLVTGQEQADDEFPSWAYGVLTPPPLPATEAAPAAPAGGGAGAAGGGGAARGGGAAGGRQGGAPAPDTTLYTLPGSPQQVLRNRIAAGFSPVDWYPQDHPQMPPIVADGRTEGNVNACALCHMPNGKGRPENAGIAGLPYEYIVQALMDFRNDRRRSTDPRKANTTRMIAIAKALTDEEIDQAAQYFSSMQWTQWIRVVETETVPQTRLQGGMFLSLANNMTEPIGNRIIEMPEDTERTEVYRDPRSGFVAYVPTGSIARGETLVMTGGNGRTVACATCHGGDLLGLGPVPGIAGRSPSYLVRQMYDTQQGNRNGTWSELMLPVVERLTAEDLVAIAAYVASRPMPPAPPVLR